jgi:hypothetical protein
MPLPAAVTIAAFSLSLPDLPSLIGRPFPQISLASSSMSIPSVSSAFPCKEPILVRGLLLPRLGRALSPKSELRSSRSRCALTADAAPLLNSFRRRRDWRDPPRLDRESSIRPSEALAGHPADGASAARDRLGAVRGRHREGALRFPWSGREGLFEDLSGRARAAPALAPEAGRVRPGSRSRSGWSWRG